MDKSVQNGTCECSSHIGRAARAEQEEYFGISQLAEAVNKITLTELVTASQ